jgi:hypothetical protein
MTQKRWVGLVAAVLLLGWISWRILTLGVADYLSHSQPLAALEWRSTLAEALFRETELGFRARTTSASQAEHARLAIRSAPLDGRGYRLLARDAELRGIPGTTASLYSVAGARGPRDLPTLGWLSQHELIRGDNAAALAHLDQMLRVQPELSLRMNPVLLALAAQAPVQADFAALLEKMPPWRADFMPRLIVQSPDCTVLFPLIERLRKSPEGLTEQELSMWLDRLGHDRQWGPAYLTWVQSLSAEGSRRIGNVYNGSFELEPSNLGFDWRFTNEPGARITRAQVTGAKEQLALRIEFDDRRVPFQNVRQQLALAPGSYRFQGRRRLDDLRTERGLVWTLTCAEDGRAIAETEPMSGRREWESFSLDLVVPTENCGGQWLTLRLPARIPAEQRIGGVAWFDDLQIKAQ